jgi:hypothetical protein
MTIIMALPDQFEIQESRFLDLKLAFKQIIRLIQKDEQEMSLTGRQKSSRESRQTLAPLAGRYQIKLLQAIALDKNEVSGNVDIGSVLDDSNPLRNAAADEVDFCIHSAAADSAHASEAQGVVAHT